MQLDWITVGAQIINFLIIVWLLNRFLYGPISRAMAGREAEIRGRLDEARAVREEAAARERKLAEDRAAFDAEREARFAVVRREADELARELRAEVRADVEQKREAWLGELREDREDFLREVRASVSREFRELAEAALGSLVDMRLQERMVDVMIGRLRALDGREVERLAHGARRGGGIKVESGEVCDEALKGRVRQALGDVLGEDVTVHFGDAVPDLIGIRLRGGAMTLEWSLDEFLDRFIDDLSERFPEHAVTRDAGGGEQATQVTGAGGTVR